MELSSSNIKKNLIFSQKKGFLIFPEIESSTFQLKNLKTSTPKNFLYFRETETETPKNFYVSGNENSKKRLIFQEVTCKA